MTTATARCAYLSAFLPSYRRAFLPSYLPTFLPSYPRTLPPVQVRASARLKYLVHTLGVDDFRALVEKYHGKPIEPWAALPEWKYFDWMG